MKLLFTLQILFFMSACELYKSEDRREFENLQSYKLTLLNADLICHESSQKKDCGRIEKTLFRPNLICQSTDLSEDQLNAVTDYFCSMNSTEVRKSLVQDNNY